MRTEHPRSDTDPYSLGHIDRGVNAGAVRHRGSGERDRDYFGCRRTRGCAHSDFNCLGLPARAASTFPGALLTVAGVITARSGVAKSLARRLWRTPPRSRPGTNVADAAH